MLFLQSPIRRLHLVLLSRRVPCVINTSVDQAHIPFPPSLLLPLFASLSRLFANWCCPSPLQAGEGRPQAPPAACPLAAPLSPADLPRARGCAATCAPAGSFGQSLREALAGAAGGGHRLWWAQATLPRSLAAPGSCLRRAQLLCEQPGLPAAPSIYPPGIRNTLM